MPFRLPGIALALVDGRQQLVGGLARCRVVRAVSKVRPALLQVVLFGSDPGQPEMGSGVGWILAEKFLKLIARLIHPAEGEQHSCRTQPHRIGPAAGQLRRPLQRRNRGLGIVGCQGNALVVGPVGILAIEPARLLETGGGFGQEVVGQVNHSEPAPALRRPRRLLDGGAGG